jgi:hypothetical protein
MEERSMKMNGIFALRSALSLFAGLLFASPVMAAPPPAGELLFELPARISAGRHEMEIAFRKGAKPVAAEKISFETAREDRARAVELLAWHPRQRAQVLRLSTDPTSAVEVSIVLDGRQTVLPLESLVVQSRVLQQGNRERVHARLETPATAPFQTKDAHDDCVNDCYNTYYACSDPCTDYACIQDCQYWFNQCYYGCPPPCSGPTVRTYSTTTITSASWVTTQCVAGPTFTTGSYYDRYNYTYRVDNHSETTQCDGSKTDEITSTSYGSGYCWQPTNINCYGGSSEPWPLCN